MTDGNRSIWVYFPHASQQQSAARQQHSPPSDCHCSASLSRNAARSTGKGDEVGHWTFPSRTGLPSGDRTAHRIASPPITSVGRRRRRHRGSWPKQTPSVRSGCILHDGRGGEVKDKMEKMSRIRGASLFGRARATGGDPPPSAARPVEHVSPCTVVACARYRWFPSQELSAVSYQLSVGRTLPAARHRRASAFIGGSKPLRPPLRISSAHSIRAQSVFKPWPVFSVAVARGRRFRYHARSPWHPRTGLDVSRSV